MLDLASQLTLFRLNDHLTRTCKILPLARSDQDDLQEWILGLILNYKPGQLNRPLQEESVIDIMNFANKCRQQISKKFYFLK